LNPGRTALPPDADGQRPRLSGRDVAALAILVAAIGALQFGLFNHDFSVNGLRYADDVERGVELFHPNHLLPNFLYRGVYLLALKIGPGGLRAIWLMQAINVCAGLVAAMAVARIALRHGERAVAMLVGALYAAGFAAWNFAEEPDVYILPAAAVAVSLALLCARRSLQWPAIFALASLAVFAVLTLQQYVLWYPALLALVAARDLGTARRAKLLLLAVGVPAICLLAYVAVGALQGRLDGIDHALGWFLGYAWTDQHGFATFRPAPELAARLFGTLLAAGNLAVAYEVILSPVTAGLAAAALVALVLVAARCLRSLRSAASPLRHDAIVVLAWCVANLAFATWWESRNIEFLFPVWLGASVLAALAAGAVDRRLLAASVLLVGGVNLAAAFWPEHDWPQRYRVAEALARHEKLGSSDLLITEELNTIGYLHYFDRVDVGFQPGAVSGAMHASTPVARARAAIDSALASGTRVYTTEIDEHGRLRQIARWFAPLGRNGFDGSVDRDIADLYAGLDTSQMVVPGARRVLPSPAPR
jgi:hypothetical protein